VWFGFRLVDQHNQEWSSELHSLECIWGKDGEEIGPWFFGKTFHKRFGNSDQ